MSITFMINDNEEYLKANAPHLIEEEVFTCQCVDHSEDGKPWADCFTCSGKGSVSFTRYPFELNLANANFRTLMNSLGLSDDDCGELDPRTILKAISRTPARLIERQTRVVSNPNHAQVIECGIGKEQAERYMVNLVKIVEEAEKREEQVYWC